MSRLHLPIAAAAILASATALGAGSTDTATGEMTREQQLEEMFSRIDANGDGVIDANEARADKGLASAFPRIAGSGTLDRQQFAAWMKAYDMEPAQE